MIHSMFKVQGSTALRIPQSALRTSPPGFTYIALLAAIVIIGISMSAAGKYWQNVMMREKEEELLFRGDQYRLAIERYYLAKAPNMLPANIDDLLKDDRFPQAKRHLRRKYQDPVTGEDFEVARDMVKGNRIYAVFSKSEKEPIKRSGFPEQYKEFENKAQYKDWRFEYKVEVQQQILPGGLTPRGPRSVVPVAPVPTPPKP